MMLYAAPVIGFLLGALPASLVTGSSFLVDTIFIVPYCWVGIFCARGYSGVSLLTGEPL